MVTCDWEFWGESLSTKIDRTNLDTTTIIPDLNSSIIQQSSICDSTGLAMLSKFESVWLPDCLHAHLSDVSKILSKNLTGKSSLACLVLSAPQLIAMSLYSSVTMQKAHKNSFWKKFWIGQAKNVNLLWLIYDLLFGVTSYHTESVKAITSTTLHNNYTSTI